MTTTQPPSERAVARRVWYCPSCVVTLPLPNARDKCPWCHTLLELREVICEAEP